MEIIYLYKMEFKMEIKILGTGCPKCTNLEKAVLKAVEVIDPAIIVTKVESIDEIMDYGVMMTPGLVIDEELITAGKVHSIEQIKKMILDRQS